MVQIVALVVTHVERHDADAFFGVRVAENFDILVAGPTRQRALGQFDLAGVNDVGADTILDLEYQCGFQGLQHTGRTGLLAFLDVLDEVLVAHADVIDCAAGADTRRQAAIVDALVEDQHAAGAGPAEELVRRDEDGVDRRVFVADRLGVHVDIDIRRTRGVIEAGDRAIPVQQARDPPDVRLDTRYVRCCGE